MSDMPNQNHGLTPLHVHLIGASISVVAVALAWWFGISPVLSAQAESKAQQQAILQQEQKAEAIHNQLIQVERQIGRALAEEKRSPLRLEPVSRINRRLSDIAELALTCGLQADVIQPGRVIAKTRFELVPIRLEGIGSFPDCTRFLQEANQHFPDMGVASVSIEHRPSTEGQSEAADFEVTLVWYAAPSDSRQQTAEVAVP